MGHGTSFILISWKLRRILECSIRCLTWFLVYCHQNQFVIFWHVKNCHLWVWMPCNLWDWIFCQFYRFMRHVRISYFRMFIVWSLYHSHVAFSFYLCRVHYVRFHTGEFLTDDEPAFDFMSQVFWLWQCHNDVNIWDFLEILKLSFGTRRPVLLSSTNLFINKHCVKSCDKRFAWENPFDTSDT